MAVRPRCTRRGSQGYRRRGRRGACSNTRTEAQLARELRVARNIANPTAEDTARYASLQDKELTIANLGRYAALRGYDAIDASATMRNKEWVILNRTALLVQR